MLFFFKNTYSNSNLYLYFACCLSLEVQTWFSLLSETSTTSCCQSWRCVLSRKQVIFGCVALWFKRTAWKQVIHIMLHKPWHFHGNLKYYQPWRAQCMPPIPLYSSNTRTFLGAAILESDVTTETSCTASGVPLEIYSKTLNSYGFLWYKFDLNR